MRRLALQNAAVGVTDGDRKCIGAVGLHAALQPEQDLHHVLHLQLVGAALAGEREFHFAGRVFVKRQVRRQRGADGSRARLTQFQRAVGILVHKGLFHRQFPGCELRQHRTYPLENPAQTGAKIAAGDADAAAGHVPEPLTVVIHHAITGKQRAGIDAEDAHSLAHEALSRASGNSALEYTACTSSRSSSASSNSSTAGACSVESVTAVEARSVTSADSGLSPARSRSVFTLWNAAGSVSTSKLPSSPLTMSSAPASSAAVISLSSLVPAGNL